MGRRSMMSVIDDGEVRRKPVMYRCSSVRLAPACCAWTTWSATQAATRNIATATTRIVFM